MRALLLCGVCFLAGCSGTTNAPPPALDQEIKVAFSHQATIEDEALTLTFKEINEDSRCPIGVQCFWAGRATITIEASKEGVSPQALALTPSANTANSAAYSGYSISLLELEPYPVAGRQVTPEEYVATLVVTKHREGVAGPCVHGYREPVLSIRSATSTPAQTNISRLALDSFVVNGQPRNAQDWGEPSSEWSNPSFNVTVADGVLYCDVPCGFGAEEGHYSFVVSAPGHESKAISVTAGYASFAGGCPSWSDVGTDVHVELAGS